ncbi:peptidase A24 [Fervidicella metallireducens AeB]|uniref:Peptidase A24 n=1 Tax=Fervidicella metallireducens AeB TaxID=1403537 RepID=A0A017RYN2_9CLOT|nr:A24 family peptidase [Fervidicella metallireducens]EYE89686.1 peptidase A24 [Fervidicella metallireducens AeB]
MILGFVILFSLLIGSFLNVCIYRIPREESISYPPSHCVNCGSRIKLYDLIPIISYLFLGGRCRNCKSRISIEYPVIEFITAVIFLMIYINYGLSFEFIKYSILTAFMIVIGMIDYKTTDVYFKISISAIITGIIFTVIGKYLGSGILEYIYGAALGGGIITLIILITKGMGWGDAEICTICGLFLGFRLTMLLLFLSFIIGGATGVILILLKKKSPRDYIPFGPSIALASVITVIFGERILSWYFSLF